MMLMAGGMADFVTEPAMRAETPFSQGVGWLVGSGPGSGMSLQFVLSGILFLSVTIIAFLTPAFRRIEQNLPDHDEMRNGIAMPAGADDEIQTAPHI